MCSNGEDKVSVSVIVPVYNAEKYLSQCLDSLMTQTLEDIEFICINDGSTDASLSILKRYEGIDNRFKVIDKSNEGYGKTMNRGIDLARGEYIGILESDDIAFNGAFEALYTGVNGSKPDIIKGNFTELRGNNEVERSYYDGIGYHSIIDPKTNYKIIKAGIFLWTGIYRRDFLINNNIRFNETSGASYQDTSFYFLSLFCSDSIVLIPDFITKYRCDNPESSVRGKDKVYCICDEFNYLEEQMRIHGVFERFWGLETYLKYTRYIWNFYRIADFYKIPFLHKMHSEFELLSHTEALEQIIWDETEWDDMQLLIHDEELFYIKHTREKIGNRATKYNYKWFMYSKKGIIDGLKKEKAIYVYGAGKTGMSLIKRLFDIEVDNIRGIIVTDKSKDKLLLNDLSVFQADELDMNERSKLVIIAVSSKNKDEVKSNLRDLQYTNVQEIDDFFSLIWSEG